MPLFLDMKKDLLNLYRCLDLTSLNSTDNPVNILELINWAKTQEKKGHVLASICTFPNFTFLVNDHLVDSQIKTTAVSGSFPTSQTFLKVKKLETKMAIEAGADEIDIVINLGAFFEKNFKEVKREIQQLKIIVGDKCLKVILETGELKSKENIQIAAQLAIEAGADFIKTSTGKSTIGATTDAVTAMCQVIHTHYKQTDKKVGIKISGGVRTFEQALEYQEIVLKQLGKEWLHPSLFRIGASSLATNLIELLEE